ncbi:MAG: hypothetical protein ACRCT1_21850 [Microcoleaceae cyanobacterium]
MAFARAARSRFSGLIKIEEKRKRDRRGRPATQWPSGLAKHSIKTYSHSQ